MLCKMKHHKSVTVEDHCVGEEKKAEDPVEDDATKAVISTSFKGPSLNLDPSNPPKYCPQCAWAGVKSKVKKLKIDPASQKLVIMCKNEKCPWPFSVKSPDEVTVTDGRSGAGDGEGLFEMREDTIDTPSQGQLSKAANTQNQKMDGQLYCILCQDAHKMTASCLQDVLCKLCNEKGHLKKDCPLTDSLSSQKKVHPSDFKSRKRKASSVVEDTSGCSDIQVDNTEDKSKAQTRMATSKENLMILSDDGSDTTQIRTQVPAEHPKVKLKVKKSATLDPGKYHIVSIHIELFRSNKSSSTKLTQLSCTVYGSFFRGIKPQGLERYLDNYKLGGDLLKALHMTREDDGTFLYRSQFEIVEDDKKIICVEEKKALEDLLEFLHKFPGCVILGVDEDSVSILVKKLKDVNQRKLKELVAGFTYWKRVLKCLNADRNLDLEEYFSQRLQKDLSSHTIPEVLLTSVMDVGYKMEANFSRNSFYKLCKRIDCLKKIKNVEFDRNAEIESVEVFSSFRPSVSATFTAEKLEQVTLSSESDSEPEETGKSVSNKSEVTAGSSLSEPEEVPIDLPDVRNDGCGCSIRKKDFKTLPLPEFLANSLEDPNTTVLRKLPTRKSTWQKGKRKRSVYCPLCYCNGIEVSKVANHIAKVHKACVTCLMCYNCKAPVTPAGLAAHMAVCAALYRNTKSEPVCDNCKAPVPRSSLAAHTAKCGLLFIKLGESSRKNPTESITSSQSQPSNSSRSESSTSSQSEPSNSQLRGSQSQPMSSSQSKSAIQSDPRSTSQSQPRSSQSKSMSSSQYESKRSSQSEHNRSSQSSGITSDSNQNQQSCHILNSTGEGQTESKTSRQPNQTRENFQQPNQTRENFQQPNQTRENFQQPNQTRGIFRPHGFGPFVAHGRRPMWGNTMRGGGGPPFVRGNIWGNMNMRGSSGPWLRGMGPRGGMVGGPWLEPSQWRTMVGGRGMGPQGWGPWNLGGGMGGMGPPGLGPWNQGGLGNMSGGMGGMGPQGWESWNQEGKLGGMNGRLGPQGWDSLNHGGGMGAMAPQGWGTWNFAGGRRMRGMDNNLGGGTEGYGHG